MASPIVTDSSAQLNGASLVVGFSTTLTDAQIKALPTTPITLVAAPASGFRIKILGGTMRLNNAAGAYTNINTAYCELRVNVTAGWRLAGPVLVNDTEWSVALTGMTDVFGNAATYVLDVPTPGLLYPVDAGAQSGNSSGQLLLNPFNIPPTADVDAKAALLSINNNGSGNLTGGNAANSLKVTLYYAYEAT